MNKQYKLKVSSDNTITIKPIQKEKIDIADLENLIKISIILNNMKKTN